MAFIRALPDHQLLDRIVRGRTWIVLLFVLLAGIVAMQVEMLKLNTSIGRSIELGTALQGRNELLRESVSSLSDTARIERLASNMGMVMPAPTSVDFLNASQAHAAKAARSLQAPDPSDFESSLQTDETNAAAATAAATGTEPTSDSTSSSTASPATTDTAAVADTSTAGDASARSDPSAAADTASTSAAPAAAPTSTSSNSGE